MTAIPFKVCPLAKLGCMARLCGSKAWCLRTTFLERHMAIVRHRILFRPVLQTGLQTTHRNFGIFFQRERVTPIDQAGVAPLTIQDITAPLNSEGTTSRMTQTIREEE